MRSVLNGIVASTALGLLSAIGLGVVDYACGAEGDVVIASFDGDDYGDWSVEGNAFGTAPARGTLPSQMEVSGFNGAGLVNSYVGGDPSTGVMTSSEVELTRPFVNFLIGGGGHSGTRFELLVDGEVVRVARGPNLNPGGSEALDWETWDVSDLSGKKARFRIVDAETGGWGHINVDEITLSNKKRAGIANVRECVVDGAYLYFTIKKDAPSYWVRVEIDGKIEREFTAGLALKSDSKGTADFDACVDMRPWIGKKMKFIVEKADDELEFSPLSFSDKAFDGANNYDEKYRPQFHFSPRVGWTNDPNGLVYYNGRYHLFYQHNPFGVNWSNMTWGHATSPDLLHWIEEGDALYPDKLGTIFSGSGSVDFNNTTGFQTDPNGLAPLVLMYTYNGPSMRYGEPASQALAYSLDDGKTFVKYSGNPTLPHIVGGNRDPKIFWHDETSRWIVALYLDGEDYALFASKDLKSWEEICRIEKLGCSECPDIFPLPVDGDKKNVKWVFWGGNGKYLIGTFDGTTFKRESEPLDAKWGGNDYAAQTYSDTPGRRIQFSWMNGGQYPDMPFNQQFTVPRELTLRTTHEGIRLFTYPIKELATLRGDKLELTAQETKDAIEYAPTSGKSSDYNLLDVELTLKASQDAGEICVALRGQKILLNLTTKTLLYADVEAPLSNVDGVVKLRLVLDRTSLEIFANEGASQIAKCFVYEDENDASVLSVSGARVEKLDVWSMNRAWK